MNFVIFEKKYFVYFPYYVSKDNSNKFNHLYRIPPWVRLCFHQILPRVFRIPPRPKSIIFEEKGLEDSLMKSKIVLLEEVVYSIRTIADHVRTHNIKQAENDWKFVAMIIDRFFFWAFMFVSRVVV